MAAAPVVAEPPASTTSSTADTTTTSELPPDGGAGARARGRVRPTDGRDWRFVLGVGGALALGLALRVAIALTDDAPSTDETAYLRSGLSLAAGDGFERAGRPELHFPPFVPFLMGLFSKVFDDPHRGAAVLTCLSGTALVLPLALLARRAGGRTAGIITAWVVALTPGLSTAFVVAGAGSEAEYTLLLVVAMWLAAVASGHVGAGRLAAAGGSGLAVGLAYLTRPEGLMAAFPLLLAIALPPSLAVSASLGRPAADSSDAAAGAGSRRRRLWDWLGGGRGLVARGRAALPASAAFLLVLAVCVVPYVSFLHTHTGKWQLSAKSQDVSIEAWRAVAEDDRRMRDSILYALDDSGLELANDERTSLPALAREDPRGYAGILGFNVVNLFDTLARTYGGLPFVALLLPVPLWGLAVLGAWRLRRSRTVALLLAVGALPVATALAFFVQPRYLITALAPATVLVGAGLAGIASARWRRGLLAGTFSLLAVSCLFAFEGPGGWWHPSDHLSHRQAGEWIAANAAADDRIMARSMVVELYAERPTVAIPYGTYDEVIRYAHHYGVEYLVIDPSTYSRLRPDLAFLRGVDRTPDLRLVREVVAEGQATYVFALDPAPAGPGAPIGAGLGYVGDATG